MQLASSREYIRQLGGEVLSGDFIKHRTMSDVFKTIASASNAELCCVDKKGNTLLHHAASISDGKRIVKVLLARGLSATAANDEGMKPIHYAKTGDIAIMLLSEGSKI